MITVEQSYEDAIEELKKEHKTELDECLKALAECRDLFDPFDDTSMQEPLEVPRFVKEQLAKAVQQAEERTRQQCADALSKYLNDTPDELHEDVMLEVIINAGKTGEGE